MKSQDDSLYSLSLASWCSVLNSISQLDSCRNSCDDCTYAAAKILQIVLDRAATINLESFPYDERDSLTELREHINHVNTLLPRPSTTTEDIKEGCREAVDHLCYVLELVNLRLASKIEALCLIILEDDLSWRINSMTN